MIDTAKFETDMVAWIGNRLDAIEKSLAPVLSEAVVEPVALADPSEPPLEEPEWIGKYFGDEKDSKPVEALTILTFDQIEALPLDPDDTILGDNLLEKGGSLVIAGQGGTGKSRLIFQFIAACKSGREKFLDFAVHPGSRDMKWLILQTENSKKRLKKERERIRKWIGEEAWAKFNAEVFVLCPGKEGDTMLNLDEPENVQKIKDALDLFKPDGVIADPLGDYAMGDLNKDVDMRQTIMTLSQLRRYGNPKRALILLHHSLTGQAGVSKATGYDRTSFARNSKVLFNWTRAQINVAPMNPDNNAVLAVTCGKCSDGREFKSFAVELDMESLIYSVDPSQDVEAWAKEVKGNKKNAPEIDSDGVMELCRPAITKPELAKAIMADVGCSRQSAYRHIHRAVTEKTIRESDGAFFKA